MKNLSIAAILLLTLAYSCSKEKELSTAEAERESVTFPELDSFMPEEDVPRQRRSPKRGVCTNFRIDAMPSLLGSGVSWCYNWSHSPLSEQRKAALQAAEMEFVPMVWNAGLSLDNLSQLGSSSYLLAYNEPNLLDQANMTPSQAAAAWPVLKQAANSLDLKIVGPAVNYGTLPSYSDPVKWYDDFLACDGVNADDLSAIALHSYMPNGASLKSLMINRFRKYGKPLWLTEFANGEAGSLAAQQEFLSQAVTYLEADPGVERYAWFMDNTGSNDKAPHYPLVTLPSVNVTEPQLSDLGRLYIGMSSYDKSLWYPVDENIPAEHYNSQIEEESAGGEEWGSFVPTRITSDIYGDLELYSMKGGVWVEYNINVPATRKYRIDLRYCSKQESVVKIDCPGVTSAIATLPSTDGSWVTSGYVMVLPKGKTSVRLNVATGDFSLNWLRFTSPK